MRRSGSRHPNPRCRPGELERRRLATSAADRSPTPDGDVTRRAVLEAGVLGGVAIVLASVAGCRADLPRPPTEPTGVGVDGVERVGARRTRRRRRPHCGRPPLRRPGRAASPWRQRRPRRRPARSSAASATSHAIAPLPSPIRRPAIRARCCLLPNGKLVALRPDLHPRRLRGRVRPVVGPADLPMSWRDVRSETRRPRHRWPDRPAPDRPADPRRPGDRGRG